MFILHSNVAILKEDGALGVFFFGPFAELPSTIFFFSLKKHLRLGNRLSSTFRRRIQVKKHDYKD